MGHETGDGIVAVNGVDGSTGSYALQVPVDLLAKVAAGEALDAEERAALEAHVRLKRTVSFGLDAAFDPVDVASSGWGVVFASDADPALRDALAPLLDLRQKQAGDRYREYSGPEGHRPGESSARWVERHGSAPGQPANPAKIPYYLLVVGDAERVPYRFQYQLDVSYAVGRLSFPTTEQYARYAEGVVAAESAAASSTAPSVALIGTANRDDRATRESVEHLVRPLGEWLAKDHAGIPVRTITGDEATRAAVVDALGGPARARLVLTATHGMTFPLGDARQEQHQGALVCAEWPGPIQWRKEVPEDFYVAATGIGDDADVSGLVAFTFACFGAGTPLTDDFAGAAFGADAAQIAPRPFVAALPQRLLSHPRGAALATIGHVDRVWSYSFQWPRSGEQLEVFQLMLDLLLRGVPVGHAMDCFNDRYAALTTDLEDEKENAKAGQRDDGLLSGLWIARNDARNFVVNGDPAVRLIAPPA